MAYSCEFGSLTMGAGTTNPLGCPSSDAAALFRAADALCCHCSTSWVVTCSLGRCSDAIMRGDGCSFVCSAAIYFFQADVQIAVRHME